MRILALFSLATTLRAVSNKCFSDSECSEVWPGASCVRSRCRCPPDTVRKKSASREFVCLSLIDITTGEAGPPLTCPLPEGAGYQVVLRNGSSSTFCSSKAENCPDGYECIQGFGVTSDYGYDGVCCPSRETTCTHPIFDNDDGTLSRWGFDGQNCIQYLWNPNRASTANCEIRFNVDNASWLPEELKEPLKKHLANRINHDGELIIDSDRTRERNMNLADCFDKLRSTIYEVQREQNLRTESEADKEMLRKKAEKAAKHRADQMVQDGSCTEEFAKLLLRRETTICSLPARLAQGYCVIGWEDRDREAAWICSAARRLGLDMDSSSSAIAIMDKLVCSIKVNPKYINCVAATCLHIAKKLWEDYDENTSSFLQRLRLEYSTSEIKRMELRILEILQWDVQLPTVSRFLDAILSPLGGTYLIGPLRTHIEHIICNWRLVSAFRPSTIALSVVSLLLEGSRRNWVHSSHHLLKSLNIDISELVRCRENISSFWHPSLLPRFSSYGILSSSSEEDDRIHPIHPMDTTSPRCSFSTPHPSAEFELTSPQAQPTPC